MFRNGKNIYDHEIGNDQRPGILHRTPGANLPDMIDTFAGGGYV